jgi:deferrochelatase/peroxidase EfeB
MALGALGAGGVARGLWPEQAAAADRDRIDLTTSHPFYDEAHPAGIATPPQRYAIYMTFDLVDGALATDLQALLARWTAAIAQLMKGRPVGQVQPTRVDAVGGDTGEATGLDPASLTVTVGLGPGIFDHRFGLAGKRPPLLHELPDLPSDRLAPETTGGDLSLQVCADDPQVAYHAVRNLARMVRDTAHTRWAVLGFGRASAGQGQETPRNLFGFKDGTRNLRTATEFDKHVWVGDGWLAGGTYQVVRKIQMNLEIWDADMISDQERIFGRTKLEGAPLSGGREMTAPNFTAKGADGTPKIPLTSHVALAAHENNGGIQILRRGYNYTDGINQDGQLDAGLLFICYQNDPEHFIKLQTKLGASDRMNEYVQHIGSATFAVPPAPRTGHYIGEQLFA